MTSSKVNSCDTQKITKAHLSFLSKLELPKNSLLSITRGEYSIITDHITKNQIRITGSKPLNIIQMTANKPILQQITYTNFNFDILNFLEKLKYSNHKKIIISRDGIFVLTDKPKINNIFPCDTIVFILDKHSQKYTQVTSKYRKNFNRSLELSENAIILSLLDSNYDFNNLEDTITLNLNINQHPKEIIKEISNNQQNNTLAKNLVIKLQGQGVQISEMNIPISSYERALRFKDSNELYYLTTFKPSKNPKLARSKAYYNFDVGRKNTQSYMAVHNTLGISKYLNSNLSLKYSDPTINIDRLSLGFKKFGNKDFFYSAHIGRFPSDNTGLLINTYGLNEEKENLINTSIYIDVNQNCINCIRNGFSLSFERLIKSQNNYIKLNLLRQNYKTQSDTTLEFILRKPLTEYRSAKLSAQYDLNSQSTNLAFKLNYLFNSNQSKLISSGSISYLSRKKELISDWTENTNKVLFENTSGFLQRNWKNYIRFD